MTLFEIILYSILGTCILSWYSFICYKIGARDGRKQGRRVELLKLKEQLKRIYNL